MRPILVVSLMLTCAVALAQDDSLRITQLTEARNNGTASREQNIELARDYLSAGRYADASQIARELLDADALDADARAIRDEATKQREAAYAPRIAEARERAERSDATDADRLALANVWFDAGRYGDAVSIYAHLPASAMTRDDRLRYARALSWSGRMYTAEPVYTALLAEETTPDLELEYGRMLSWMGATGASMQHLNNAYKQASSEESAIALANAHAWSGDRDAGIQVLREFTQTHPESKRAAALLRTFETSPQLRIERVDRMIAADPNNLALRLERARLLIDAGHFNEGLQQITFIREHWSEPVEGLAELERRAKDGRDQEAKATRERLRGIDRNDARSADEILALAQAFTSTGDYDEASALYDDYLRLRPEDGKARHNYARVLSWDKRWAAAERQYQILLRDDPSRADIRFEYAQVLSYDAHYATAVPMFSSLTDLSANRSAYLYTDIPPRAHYSLGQIYRWYGWNEHAVEEENSAISLDGGYLPAREELELARNGRPASLFSTRYSESTNSNDFTLRRADLEGEVWRNQRFAWEFGVGRHNFEHQGDDVDATSLSGGAAYRYNDAWTVRGRIGATMYTESLGTRPFWTLGAAWTPSLQSRAAFDYSRRDLIYDVFTLSSLTPTPGPQQSPTDAISIDDLGARYSHDTGGRLSFLGDAAYGFVSDNNRRAAAHGIVSFRLLKNPFIAVKADGGVLSYDFRTNRYWSPTDYKSLAGVLQVGQNLRDRIFWTAEVKFGRSWDNGDSADLRAYAARVTVPINDVLDAVGSWSYGRTGQLDTILGTGNDRVSYWQRSWYVGIQFKRLFARGDRSSANRYYFDNRQLTTPETQP